MVRVSMKSVMSLMKLVFDPRMTRAGSVERVHFRSDVWFMLFIRIKKGDQATPLNESVIHCFVTLNVKT